MVQTYATVQKCFRLPPDCFSPQPQVHSMVVKIFPAPPIFSVNDRRHYADVVRALFSHRRKTVRNCLKGSVGSMLERTWVDRVVTALAGRDPEEPAGRAVPRGFCDDCK